MRDNRLLARAKDERYKEKYMNEKGKRKMAWFVLLLLRVKSLFCASLPSDKKL